MLRRFTTILSSSLLKKILILLGGAVLGALGGLTLCGVAAAAFFLRRRSSPGWALRDFLVLGVCGLVVVAGLLLETQYLMLPDGLVEMSSRGEERLLGGLFGVLFAGFVLWALRPRER